MSSSTTRSLPKLKSIKKMELATVFRGRKRQLQETPSGFTEAFIQGSDNFKTSALSDHHKSKMHMQAVNECIFRPAPVSMSVPKNAPILKGFNRTQATEKVALIKLFELAYLIGKSRVDKTV